MRLLFLFLPVVLGFGYPRAPGMYPPEETRSSSVTVPPSPYGGDEEGPYLFYYEKDPAPPSSKSAQAPGSQNRKPFTGSSLKQSKTTESKEYDGPVPPPRGSSSSGPDKSWAKYINNPSSTSSKTETDSEDPYGGSNPPVSSSGHGSSSGPSTGGSSEPTDPTNPYKSGKSTGPGYESGKGSVKSTGQEYGSGIGSSHAHTHLPGSHPEGDSSTDSLPPIDPYENGKSSGSGQNNKGSGQRTGPIYMSVKTREEITGGKGYRDDRQETFQEDEQLTLTPGRSITITKRTDEDASEVQREVNRLQSLPVTEEGEEEFKSSTRKPCCACCKDSQMNKPILGGGYIETASSAQIAPGPQPELLSPTPIIQSPQTGYPLPNVASNPVGYSSNPLVQSYYTPVQSSPVGGYGSGGGGCGCAPQICCQPVQPCCMPSLPCCPPLPPIPCCPQISICCQPVVPCCLPQITLPQICLPTIPLCFRGCPACPCRRRRSIDDPRHHSRVKRQNCMRRRVKRQSGCRQCSNWNAITQVAGGGGGGCGTCNGSHRRAKRMGCLPCGRKKREALEEVAHIRRKRSCLPCLNGRKKRETPGSCKKCSLLQTVVSSRQKRSFNCGPCGGRKKRDATCSCASSTRQKRAINDFDTFDQCDRSCCDYSKCSALRARKLDLKN